jgi:predicted O-methyltransferase YrrM
MTKLFLKGVRYLKCYGELSFHSRPRTPEAAVDFCVDRPILMTQVRSEIIELGKILQASAPMRSLEIGTAYGGTLFLLCTVSPPGAQIISVDLRRGQFGGGYPRRKIPLFRKFPKNGQELHLIQGDSHSAATKDRVKQILNCEPLDYLFIDGDHTYAGAKQDFEMYSPLVRSGGMIAFHDIAAHDKDLNCDVANFWNEIKSRFEYREIIEAREQGWAGLGIVYKP